MAQSTSEDEEVISQINVTPLVDIVLVMLLVFIVTTSMVVHNTIEMNLPKAATGSDEVPDLINVAVDQNGVLYINGLPSKMEDLPAYIALKKKEISDTPWKKLTALVSADVKTPYGEFVKVVDKLREEGILDVALDVKPENGGS